MEARKISASLVLFRTVQVKGVMLVAFLGPTLQRALL
jgi:hypothetical protein